MLKFVTNSAPNNPRVLNDAGISQQKRGERCSSFCHLNAPMRRSYPTELKRRSELEGARGGAGKLITSGGRESKQSGPSSLIALDQ